MNAHQIAQAHFIDMLQNRFELNKQQAQHVFNTYMQNQVLRLDKKEKRYNVTHCAYLNENVVYATL